MTDKNEDNVLTFEIHYYDWNTWLPENRDCKVVGCLSYDVLVLLIKGFGLQKVIYQIIYLRIFEYGENKRKLNEVITYKYTK